MTELDTSEYTAAPKKEEQQEEQQQEEVDPEQVQTFLSKLEYIVNNTRNQALAEIGMNVLADIKENGRASENILIRRFQCLKCKEVFPTEKSFKCHYHSNPGCGDTPRWQTNYENPEDQLNVIRK